MITLDLLEIDLTKETIKEKLIKFDGIGSYMVYYNIYSGTISFEKGDQYFGVFLCELRITTDPNLEENTEIIFDAYRKYKNRMNIKFINLKDVSCKTFYKDIISGNISIFYFSELDPNYNLIKKQLVNKLTVLKKDIDSELRSKLE